MKVGSLFTPKRRICRPLIEAGKTYEGWINGRWVRRYVEYIEPSNVYGQQWWVRYRTKTTRGTIRLADFEDWVIDSWNRKLKIQKEV